MTYALGEWHHVSMDYHPTTSTFTLTIDDQAPLTAAMATPSEVDGFRFVQTSAGQDRWSVFDNVKVSVATPVPEPSTLALLACGLGRPAGPRSAPAVVDCITEIGGARYECAALTCRQGITYRYPGRRVSRRPRWKAGGTPALRLMRIGYPIVLQPLTAGRNADETPYAFLLHR